MLHFLRKSKKLRYSRKPFTMSFMLKEATGSAKINLGPSYQHPTLFYYGIDIFLLEISSNKEPEKIRGWTAMVSCWHSTMVFCYQNCSNLLWEKNCSSDQEKTFEIRGWRPRICKIFEITRTIYSNCERSEQFLVTESFFNLFLEVSHII